VALRPAVFDRHVLPLNKAGPLETLPELGRVVRTSRSGDKMCMKPTIGIAGCCARAASGHAAAAQLRSVMKSRRAAHSITSSARASSVGGITRPSALAVLRLITSWYLDACSTGRSAG